LTEFIARPTSAFILKADNCDRDLNRLAEPLLNFTSYRFSQTDIAKIENLSEQQRQKQGSTSTRVETMYPAHAFSS
jgi:hypothetical protein